MGARVTMLLLMLLTAVEVSAQPRIAVGAYASGFSQKPNAVMGAGLSAGTLTELTGFVVSMGGINDGESNKKTVGLELLLSPTTDRFYFSFGLQSKEGSTTHGRLAGVHLLVGAALLNFSWSEHEAFRMGISITQ